MRDERFSARTLDAGGSLDARRVAEALEALRAYGAVHVTRTGLVGVEAVQRVLSPLGFGERERFTDGGRTSAQRQEKWAAPGLRRMDHYPPELYLLPSNEVQYQRRGPRHVLLACTVAPEVGGRVFVHSARAVEEELRRGEAGRALLARIAREGLAIETGFLDRDHPLKSENYFQSWQERFGTDEPDEALARARGRADEYDACWWRDDRTLMTRITLNAWWTHPDDGERYLRFPRVARDAPSARNGYRRFPLGNDEELAEADLGLLRAAYLATREGTTLCAGDLVLFDNLRYGHSREPFRGAREVLVGMAGELHDPCVPDAASPLPPIARCASDGPTRYVLPPAAVDRAARFSARTFDAGGALDERTLDAIRREFERAGALHVQRTGLGGAALPDEVLGALRFGGDHAFPWGGLSSGRTTRRQVSRELRATDDYPAHLWLLPHNEVLYQRRMPSRLLFFSAEAGDPSRGGRTFVHSARRLEAWLRARGAAGRALLDSLRAHGYLIEMGFLDEAHPEKASNSFRSWQDRFQTHDRAEAEARCRASTLQFDECWWRDEGHGCATLMTRIRVPAFHANTLLFPRVGLDAPALRNGHRRYPRGNGDELSDDELDLLLDGFLATREGVHYGAGDLLLVDNVRYGHSREAFEGPRSLATAMAGVITIDGSPR
jgi:alpha-ketoglutarate-dependent taurine dioxygenase